MKALVVIESYGTSNDKYLHRLVEEYRSMSFDVDLVVLSNIPKAVADGVEVIVVPRRKNPWTRRGTFQEKRGLRSLWHEYRDWVRHLDLPFAHKQILADGLNDYDLFLYSEDDTLITEQNLRAFLSVSAVMNDDEIPGFLRFELGSGGEINYPEVHGHFHWQPSSVCTRGDYTLAFFTNEHAACYVATRSQLRRAIDSGRFLVGPHGGKYDLLCTAATDIYTQCGFKKLICISALDDFLIHHLPNKYVKTEFGVEDPELRRQVSRLLELGKSENRNTVLFDTETKFVDRSYSKGYYEPARPELTSGWPGSVRSILSIGSGRGDVESALIGKGVNVAAIPLDSIISGAAEAEGVEIIGGDFEQARGKLEGRQFDGLLISNVLHLVPDPEDLLASLASLVSPGGTCIAVVPNTSRLETSLTAKLGKRSDELERFRTTGVQRTSNRTVQSWFRFAGFRVETVKQILRPSAQRIGRMTMGLMNSWLTYEFIITASKPFAPRTEHQTGKLQRAGLRA